MPQRIALRLLLPWLIASAPLTLHSQSTDSNAASLPRFEVASVKPSNMSERGSIGVNVDPDGKVHATHLTLRLLLLIAFDIPPDKIAGGPSWKDSEQFDIIGVPPSGQSGTVGGASINSKLTKEQRLMLQSVLVDRFSFRYHYASIQGKVLELRKGKGTLQLVPTKAPASAPYVGGNQGGMITGDGLQGRNASMDLVASTIGQFLGAPVINQTGLSGAFDFKYSYESEDPATRHDEADLSATILASVRALGLDLKQSTGEIKILVIDQIEQPSSN